MKHIQNPKVATDGQVLFTLNACFRICWYYSLYSIHFWRQKLEIRSTSSRMNTSTNSAHLRKIHIFFIKLGWRSFFILFIFHSKFHFLDLFFSNSSWCKWRHSAIIFGADYTYHHISNSSWCKWRHSAIIFGADYTHLHISNSSWCKWRHSAIIFGADYTHHHISSEGVSVS